MSERRKPALSSASLGHCFTYSLYNNLQSLTIIIKIETFFLDFLKLKYFFSLKFLSHQSKTPEHLLLTDNFLNDNNFVKRKTVYVSIGGTGGTLKAFGPFLTKLP